MSFGFDLNSLPFITREMWMFLLQVAVSDITLRAACWWMTECSFIRRTHTCRSLPSVMVFYLLPRRAFVAKVQVFPHFCARENTVQPSAAWVLFYSRLLQCCFLKKAMRIIPSSFFVANENPVITSFRRWRGVPSGFPLGFLLELSEVWSVWTLARSLKMARFFPMKVVFFFVFF